MDPMGCIEKQLMFGMFIFGKFNGGGRIKPFLKIFNECRSLTGVGELNPIEDLQ